MQPWKPEAPTFLFKETLMGKVETCQITKIQSDKRHNRGKLSIAYWGFITSGWGSVLCTLYHLEPMTTLWCRHHHQLVDKVRWPARLHKAANPMLTGRFRISNHWDKYKVPLSRPHTKSKDMNSDHLAAEPAFWTILPPCFPGRLWEH